MDNMLNIIKLKAYSTTLIIVEVYNKKIGEWYLIDLDKDILHLNVEKRLKEIEKIEGITDTY